MGAPAFTTLALKNLPGDVTRRNVCQMLDRESFCNMYDFVYVPANFKTMKSCCYAFLNFVDHVVAERARLHFQSFSWPSHNGANIVQVAWSESHQGLVSQLEHFRNSPVMHEDVPDDFKPILLYNGTRVPFPPPTKELSAPRGFRS